MSENVRGRPASPLGWAGLSERVCESLINIALGTMVMVIVLDVITRNVFGFSFQISDEICGYMLVAATFLAMPVSLANNGFHKMEFLEEGLRGRAGLILRIFTDILSLIVCLVIEWQLIRFTIQTFRSGNIAMTDLRTPLWIPQAVMPIGFGILCVVLVSMILSKLAHLHPSKPTTSIVE